MNPNNEAMLAALLGKALNSVSITQRSGGIHPREYRRMVQRYRAVYDPNLRFHAFAYDIQIRDAKIREAILKLLRAELTQFIREDRTYSATYAIFGGLGSGSSIDKILENIAKAAIVKGPEAASRAFYDEFCYGCITFQHLFLLSGIKVEKEIHVFDGISLVPLPNSTNHLPGYLSDLFRIDEGDFLSKTLLKVNASISPILHKPEQNYTIQSGPDKHFNISVKSAKAADFNPGKFFLALTLVGAHPIFSAIRWPYLSDDHIFDLRLGPGSSYSYDARRASSTVFSVAQFANCHRSLRQDYWSSTKRR